MKPTIGSPVHYVNHRGTHIAAIVTKVHSDTDVSLAAFPPAGELAAPQLVVPHDATAKLENTWHWPEREG